MSVITQPMPGVLEKSSDIPDMAIYRLTVDQYHQIIRAGIIGEDEPVELLKGWLVRKMGKNPPRRVATKLAREALEQILPPGWYVDSQEPVTTEDSEPEPDVSVIKGHTRQYSDRHPGPQEIGMLVEVAESTLVYDRDSKKRAYAEAHIPIYWIVNLIESVVEVYTDPTGPSERPDYRQVKVYAATDEVPVVIDGREVGRIAVRDLLP